MSFSNAGFASSRKARCSVGGSALLHFLVTFWRIRGDTDTSWVAKKSPKSTPCNIGPKSYLRNVAQRGANVSHY